MRLRDDERGVTLIELLVAMTLSLVILGATLTSFNQLYSNAHDNDTRFDAAEVARTALDRQSRQLRNLAKRLNNSAVVDTVSDYDLIFQTSDPSRTWVRYCMDTSSAPASPSRGRVWEAELALPTGTVSSPITTGMRGPCPGTGWTRRSVVADQVTNRIGGQDRPMLAYRCTDGTDACISNAATVDRIVSITSRLMVDTTPGKGPREQSVSTSVFLRNQNQAPVATFVSTPGTSRSVILNASGSTDYEGRTLTYYWFKGTMPSAIACDKPVQSIDANGRRNLWGGVLIGEGVALSYTFPATDGAAGTAQTIGLVTCDPGDRYGTAGIPPGTSVSVTIPN